MGRSLRRRLYRYVQCGVDWSVLQHNLPAVVLRYGQLFVQVKMYFGTSQAGTNGTKDDNRSFSMDAFLVSREAFRASHMAGGCAVKRMLSDNVSGSTCRLGIC